MSDESMLNTEAPEASQQSAPENQSAASPAPATSDWRASLDESLRSAPSLESIKDINNLAKSYVSAQEMLGKSIRIPTDESTAEAKQAFFEKLQGIPGVVTLPTDKSEEEMANIYAKLGRPEEPDQYKLSAEQDEKIAPQLDRETVKEFKTLAHQAGLNNEQADALVKFQLEREMAQMNAVKEQEAQAKELLQNQWGDQFQSKVHAAQHVLSTYEQQFGKEHADALRNVAGNNPIVLAALADLADKATESRAADGLGRLNFGLSPQEARQKATELRNTEAFKNPTHARHREIMAEVERLYQVAHSGQ